MKRNNLMDFHKKSVESTAISAGAGSGKTHALTSKLLLLLLKGASINEILSITFTNKAAGEIKDRLLKRLKNLTNGKDKSINDFCNILGVSRSELAELAKKLYYDVIRYFSSLKIGTIDSFFASVIKQFPYDVGVGLDIRIIDDSERKVLFNEALEKLYMKLNSDSKMLDRVFSYIKSRDNQGFKTKNHFKNLYDNFSQDYSKLIESDIYGPNLDQLTNEAEKRFKEISAYIKNEEFEKLINRTLKDISRYLEGDNIYNEKNVRTLYENLKKFFPLKNIHTLQNITVFQKDDPANLNYIQKIIERRPDLGGEIINNLRQIRNTLTNYVKAKIDYQFYQELEIFSLIREIYSKVKAEKNTLDFEDIEELTYLFLKGLGEYNYFKYRMDTSIRYILIDEFQDTSELQWNAIEPIVNEAIKADGNLIYVGDIKQSIYQWRGGDPKLFNKIKAKYNLQDERLKINYRSTPLVLNFFNSVFTAISNRYSDFDYEPQKLPPELENKSEDYGYIYVKAYQENEEIKKAVIDRIKILHENGVNYADIAVLCEKNNQIAEIETLLKLNGIPSVGSGKKSLLDDFAVSDILNFLRFLSDPFESIYLVSLLRSPIFRLEYEDLYRMKEDAGELSLNSIKKFKPEIAEALQKLLISTRYLPISRLLQKIFEEFSIFEVYPDSRETILDFYELGCNYERSNSQTSVTDFIEYLDEAGSDIKSTTASIDGVQLSTIHSAKGLEYHTVIVPFLDSKRNYRKRNQYYFKENENKGIVGFIKASTEYERFYPDKDFQENIERIKREYILEKINVLYVALTRARNNLVIIPVFDINNIGGLFFESLYPGIDFKKDPPPKYEVGRILPSKKGETRDLKWESTLNIDGSKIKKTTVSQFSDQNDENNQIEGGEFSRRISILRGLIVHRALSYIKEIPVTDEALERFLDRAVSFEGREFTKPEKIKSKDLAKTILRSVLNDKRIAKFFSKTSYSEVNTLGKEYQHLVGRIDRMLISPKSIEIIDFKTDQIKKQSDIERLVSDYKRQIETYCLTIKDMFPDKEVKGYIYFTDAPHEDKIQPVWPLQKFKN